MDTMTLHHAQIFTNTLESLQLTSTCIGISRFTENNPYMDNQKDNSLLTLLFNDCINFDTKD